MCFTPAHTLFYALTLTGTSIHAHYMYKGARRFDVLCAYFAWMEWIQLFCYYVINNDLSYTYRQLGAIMAFCQISMQPFALHASTTPSVMRTPVLKRFLFLMCLSDLLMCLGPQFDNSVVRWFPGNTWDTWQGAYHISWSFPLTQPTIYRPGHNFMLLFMIPFIASGLWTHAAALYISGPFISELITENDVSSVGSIWCFQAIIIVLVPYVHAIRIKSVYPRYMLYAILGGLMCYNYYMVHLVGATCGISVPSHH